MRSNQAYPGENKWKGWLYLLPGLLIYLVFTFYPILETIRTSFYQWDGFSARRVWVGLENYRVVFSDGQFVSAFVHNLVFIVFFCVLPVLIGLFLASLLSRKKMPGMTFFRTVLFLPQVISMVVVGVIWRWIFNPQFGPFNVLLTAVGLSSLTRPWLGTSRWLCRRWAPSVPGCSMVFV